MCKSTSLDDTIVIKQVILTLSTCMPYGTSWPDNADAVAVQLDKMIINA